MAHYAQVDEGIVLQVLVMDNGKEADEGEGSCIDWLRENVRDPQGQYTSWIKTSYNNNIRKQFAGIGFSYEEVKDIFNKTPKGLKTLKKKDLIDILFEELNKGDIEPSPFFYQAYENKPLEDFTKDLFMKLLKDELENMNIEDTIEEMEDYIEDLEDFITPLSPSSV